MSADIGFASQVPSLPGGGSAGGLGATFAPDLSTGTGTLSVPLEVPNGPNDSGPKLALRYDSGTGNGVYGVGWSIPLPRLVRSTMVGRPHYDDTDTLLLEGSGPLVRRADGTLAPQVDTGDWSIAADGDGFVATDRAGTRFHLGTSAASRIPGPGGTWAWLLDRIEDNLGETATFAWRADGPQRYLDTVSYGPFVVAFTYEGRPDPLRWGRGGFLLETTLRCSAIELRLPADAQPVVRRWDLGYRQGEPNGASQLVSVGITGFAADGSSLTAPPLTLDYSVPAAPTLTAIPALDLGATPPGLDGRGRVELVDWTGDGLPDLIEFGSGGTARVWPNRAGAWGRPLTVGSVAALAAPDARAALIDIDGDGIADVVRGDLPLAGFQPRTAGGFARPVAWATSPSVALGSSAARFADFDGDGRADVLWSAGGRLLLASRAEDTPGSVSGWQERPDLVADAAGDLPTDLADPHVFVADMTGDGTPDLVRVDGAGVRYWPYLGYGVFGARVDMADPPSLPFGVDPADITVVDLDGDGCADVLVLHEGILAWWPNRSGSGFEEPRVIPHVPLSSLGAARIADVRGTGAPAVAWTATLPSGRARWFALDPAGGVHAGLLTHVDNGVGRRTAITWSTSAQEAERDRAAGVAWQTRLPIVLPVVVRTLVTDAVSGPVGDTEFRYRDGRYDGVLREVCGFGHVTTVEHGDADVETLVTEHEFHVGLDDDGAEPATTAERIRARAIRGRVRRIERRREDGAVLDAFEQTWAVDDGPDETVLPRLTSTTKSVWEAASAPFSRVVTEQLAFDADGNVTDARERAFAGDDADAAGELRTRTVYALDPTGRYRQRAARVWQEDGAGATLSDLRIAYDGLPSGQVGAQGLVTERVALALTDAMATAVYGAELPDFAALGYLRLAGTDGWWVRLGTYARTEVAGVVHGSVSGPAGGVATIDFDASGCYPVRSQDALGNVVTAEFDLRTYRPTAVVEPSGARTDAVYDALARTIAIVEPGDTAAAPTTALAYETAVLPVTVRSRRATEPGSAPTEESQLLDGDGRIVQRRRRVGADEVAESTTTFGARGLPVRTYLPYVATGPWAPPVDALPHTRVSYDAVGRPTRTTTLGGAVATISYAPGLTEETDPAGARTRRHLDARGHAVRIEQLLDARWIASTHEYDAKGALAAQTDAAGHRTAFVRDLLGRTLRIERPESVQLAVLDAAGNTVESRVGAHRVFRSFDLGGRVVAVRHDSAAAAPVASYTYHDNGAPAPADAGAHTDGGRLVRVDDESGSTVFDYDVRGNLARKAITPTGSAEVVLGLVHRSDGTLASLAYPDGTVARYRYDDAGRLASVDGVIAQIQYDTAGHRILTRYANGAEESRTYDPATGWLSAAAVDGPGGHLREVGYEHDAVGDLIAITSPDAALAWTYGYDGLHRLTAAAQGATAYAYAYDDAGNLASTSTRGAYAYGQAGAAPNLLTGVGADAFTYDDRGHVATAPWGAHTVDAEGRLRRIVRTGGGEDAYTYDHTGRLAERRRTAADGAVSRILTPDRLVRIEDGVLVLQFFDGERVVAREKAGARSWLHADHLGSVVLVTDAAGAVAATAAYDPYGAVLSTTGAPTEHGYATSESVPGDGELVLLGVRWYAPGLGRFISPDSVVVDADDPFAWNLYAYCRDNPTSFVDPSGRSFWKIFAAVVAMVAIVALAIVVSVFTFGAATPLAIGGVTIAWSTIFAATMIGIAAGGIIGGIAAARAGGDAGDVFLGIVVGAAVGGWAAFGAVIAGAGVAGGLGLTSGTVGFGAVSGGVAGAINGAAMGFASGFAGGKNKGIGDIMEKVLVGAVIGLAVGAAVGAVSGMVAPKTSLGHDLKEAVTTPAQQTGGGPAGGIPGAAPAAPPPVNDFGDAMGKVATGFAGKVAGAAAPHVAAAIAPIAASYVVQTILVDLHAAAGSAFFDDLQEYVRTHQVDLGPFNFIKSDF